MHTENIAKCQMETLNKRQRQIIRHYIGRTLNYKAKSIIKQHCAYYGITIEQFNDWLKCYMKNYKEEKQKLIDAENMQNEA